MKKLIALVVSVSVIVAMSVTSFAAATPSATGNTTYVAATETATDSFSVNAETIAANNNQTTIVVIKGVGVDTEVNGETVKTYNITTDTIQYINQSADKTFSFIPKDHDAFKASEEDVTLTVLVGGDKINKQEAGTVVYTAEVSGGDEPTFTYGNVDGDERVTSNDAVVVLNHSSGLTELTDTNLLLAANVDGDEKITSNDAVVILNKSSGLIDKFPVEE